MSCLAPTTIMDIIHYNRKEVLKVGSGRRQGSQRRVDSSCCNALMSCLLAFSHWKYASLRSQ